jgi:hypothetical protein
VLELSRGEVGDARETAAFQALGDLEHGVMLVRRAS